MSQQFTILVTGLSGSGKSTALNVIEDAGFFCMDNIPIDLLVQIIEIYDFTSLDISNKVCIGMDVRAGALSFEEKAQGAISLLRSMIGNFRLIFLEAGTQCLLNRFKETRRRHPLSDMYPNLLDAIDAEIALMSPIREMADSIIDTTDMNVHDLSSSIKEIVQKEDKIRDMMIEVKSFGFKNGIPRDADIVMDVRFLPNPYFIEGLKDKKGTDEQVVDYLHLQKEYNEFMTHFKTLIHFILPLCRKEGRAYFNIAIGCTGGRHRSVAVAEEIAKLVTESGYSCELMHRDLS